MNHAAAEAVRISAMFYGIEPATITTKARSKSVTSARKAVCYALINVYGYSQSQVARELGLHHTAVMHSIRNPIHPDCEQVALQLADYRRTTLAGGVVGQASGDISETERAEPERCVSGVPPRLLRAVQEVDPSIGTRDSEGVGDRVTFDGSGNGKVGSLKPSAGVREDGSRKRGVDPECEWIRPSGESGTRAGLVRILREHGVRL